jgi:type II secretory pathway component PulF
MKTFGKTAAVVLGFVLGAGILIAGLILAVGGIGVLPVCLFAAAYAWVLFSFFQYRYGRQEEFLYLLRTVAEADAPLAPALWAYVLDRPHGAQRQAWLATLLFFVLPGYYWIWHRRHNFDYKVARIATRVQQGESLPSALRAVRGVASPETRLAVSIGQATGQLAICLKSLGRRGLALIWIEIIPRVVYPILVLAAIISLAAFFSAYILPRLARIFSDMHIPLPDVTVRFLAFSELAEDYFWIPIFVVAAGLFAVALLWALTTLRWFCPVVGRIYRMHIQSRVLKPLGVLLQAAQPAPEALALLAESRTFRGIAVRRLRRCGRRVEAGEPLSDSLYRAGLLPQHMVPLVHSAERAQNLPWVLNELGDFLDERAIVRMRQLSLGVFPVSVVILGLLVGFTALAIFFPLVAVLAEYAE